MATLLTQSIRVLILTAVAAVSAGAQEPVARLRVTTLPDKATVKCDGIVREESPTTLEGVKPGRHLILVEKPGYMPERRTIDLSAGQRASLEIPLERMTGLVLVRSVPEGADIDINGAHRGKAPLLLTDLPLGHYRAKASSAGYLERVVDFDIENRIPKLVTVSLASDSAFLSIRSQPAGASVSVNGLTKGVTPCTVDRLPVGNNEVVVSLAGYTVHRAVVKLQANDRQDLDIALKADPAALALISTPNGAKVFIDDVLRGQTPLTADGLEAGSHVVRVESPGFETATRTVELARGERKADEFRLVANVGTVEILTKPDGVTVVVDGVERGTSLVAGGESVGRLSLELPVGDHRVSFRLKGYGSVEKRVSITRGETVTVREAMKRVFIPDTTVTLTNGAVLVGILGGKTPAGEIKLETQLGIFTTLKASEVESVEPIKPAGGK